MTEFFLGKDISKGKWQEWQIQSYIIQQARRAGHFIEGDQNAAKRSYGAAAKAKATGMLSGSPDMRLLKSNGKIKWIELKKHYNDLIPSQEKWHKDAIALGHDVNTIYADTPKEGYEKFILLIYGD